MTVTPTRAHRVDIDLDADLDTLMGRARAIRDASTGTRVTFSPKVFIPLTMLCRDKCGYCTFAQPPARLDTPYLTPEQVLDIARALSLIHISEPTRLRLKSRLPSSA